MSTMTAAELERSVENLRGILASLMADLDRLKADMALTEATVSHHQHDFTRDIKSPPSAYAPATHTHAYASSSHVHNYQDAQVSGSSSDVSRTTGGPV